MTTQNPELLNKQVLIQEAISLRNRLRELGVSMEQPTDREIESSSLAILRERRKDFNDLGLFLLNLGNLGGGR